MKEIPKITDPLGRSWIQPKAEDMILDDNTVLMDQGSFNSLLNYQTSLPSGVYVGKMWRRNQTLCWYDRIEGDDMIIEKREIKLK